MGGEAMTTAIGNALSGLAAAGTKIAVTSNNIANKDSLQSFENGVVTNNPYTPQKVNNVSIGIGGVLVQVVDVNPATFPVNDPNSPTADPATGITQYPNVNLAQEFVNLLTARRDYEANLKVIQVESNMQEKLLNIIS